MNSGDYFVMLTTQDGGYIPMTNHDDNLAKFKTLDEAVAGGKSNTLGDIFGFEVFERGAGDNF